MMIDLPRLPLICLDTAKVTNTHDMTHGRHTVIGTLGVQIEVHCIPLFISQILPPSPLQISGRLAVPIVLMPWIICSGWRRRRHRRTLNSYPFVATRWTVPERLLNATTTSAGHRFIITLWNIQTRNCVRNCLDSRAFLFMLF